MRQHAPTRRARAHSLIELVMSLTIISLIASAVGSAVIVAAKANPSKTSPQATLMDDSRALAIIAEDLSVAKYITAGTDKSVTLIVADRTGDAIPDRLQYAWSGTVGDPLTVQLNSQSPTVVVASAQSFGLAYETQVVTKQVPAPLTYEAESVIASFELTAGSANADVSSTNAYGQVMTPALSAAAVGFLPTRVEFYARSSAPSDGASLVELRDAENSKPGATRYANATLSESALSSSFAWSNVALLPEMSYVPAGQPITLTVKQSSGNNTVARLSSNLSVPAGLLSSSNGGSSWSNSLLNSLLYRLYGQQIKAASSAIEYTRYKCMAIRVSLQSSGDARVPLQRRVRLLQEPEMLSAFWEADFSVSPTLMDLNNDGTADWYYGSGGDIPAGKLSNGVWNASNTISVQPNLSFDDVTRISMRACTAGIDKIVMVGPLHVDSDGMMLPIMMVLCDSGSGTLTLDFYNDLVGTPPYGSVPGIPAGWVDIDFIVMPQVDTVALWVNGGYIGSALFTRQADTGERGLRFSGSGPSSKFNDIRVTVGSQTFNGVATDTDDSAPEAGGSTSEGDETLLNTLNNTIKQLLK